MTANPATRSAFGLHLRRRREELRKHDPRFSLRQVAIRVGMEPAYLSKVERAEFAPPGEETILKLARDLEEDPDVLLSLAGKVASDLKEVILQRPQLFAELLRTLKAAPEGDVQRLVRVVRDGKW